MKLPVRDILLTVYLVLGVAVFLLIIGATIYQTIYGPAR